MKSEEVVELGQGWREGLTEGLDEDLPCRLAQLSGWACDRATGSLVFSFQQVSAM